MTFSKVRKITIEFHELREDKAATFIRDILTMLDLKGIYLDRLEVNGGNIKI